jgi:hypothetical protein
MEHGVIFVLGLLVALLFFVLGWGIGYSKIDDIKNVAVDLGYAKWDIDKNGKKTFHWNKVA